MDTHQEGGRERHQQSDKPKTFLVHPQLDHPYLDQTHLDQYWCDLSGVLRRYIMCSLTTQERRVTYTFVTFFSFQFLFCFVPYAWFCAHVSNTRGARVCARVCSSVLYCSHLCRGEWLSLICLYLCLHLSVVCLSAILLLKCCVHIFEAVREVAGLCSRNSLLAFTSTVLVAGSG